MPTTAPKSSASKHREPSEAHLRRKATELVVKAAELNRRLDALEASSWIKSGREQTKQQPARSAHAQTETRAKDCAALDRAMGINREEGFRREEHKIVLGVSDPRGRSLAEAHNRVVRELGAAPSRPSPTQHSQTSASDRAALDRAMGIEAAGGFRRDGHSTIFAMDHRQHNRVDRSPSHAFKPLAARAEQDVMLPEPKDDEPSVEARGEPPPGITRTATSLAFDIFGVGAARTTTPRGTK